MSFKISKNKIIEDKDPPYLIAEIGSNHNGDMDLCRKIIDSAKTAGADCVKFQFFSTNSIFSKKVYEDNYFIADDKRAWNVETTGLRKVVTAKDPDHVYWHTNHYLENELKELEAPLYPTSTTLERYDRLCDLMTERDEWSVQDIKEVLGSHEGYPRSICSHLKGDGDPSASKTCGAVVCDIARRELHAAPGCVHGADYRVFSVNEEGS